MTPEELRQLSHDLEVQKFTFDKNEAQLDRALEERKLDIERQKSRLTAISVVVAALSIVGSVLISAATVRESARLQNDSARTQFALKAAELVLQSDDPFVNQNKAQRLQDLFPSWLPPTWAQGFNWENYISENDDMKVAVAKLLIEHPERKDQIIAAYRALFQNDKTVQCFIDRLAHETHKDHQCEKRIAMDQPKERPQ